MTGRTHSITRTVRAAIESDSQHGAVVPPLYLSTNFTFSGFGKRRTYDYTRSGNPTRDALADVLTDLEGGAGAVVSSSGMSAITLVLQLLKPGDLVIAPHDCYGGTFRLLRALEARGHFRLALIDQSCVSDLNRIEHLGPRLILVETPSNPLLRITDIAALSDIARRCGSLLAVDNTFLSPVLQQPIALGADIVIHSTTKYLNGHSDVVGGAVVAANDELAEELRWWANCLGVTGAPFDSFLTLRGVRTIHSRLRQHEENAATLATYLADHPAVSKVYYPGLSDHPGHAIAKRQQQGFGGMLSFDLRGGEAVVRRFLENLQFFSLAESLGGVESLVCHPASMTHSSLKEEDLSRAGISQGLIRLSTGIEHPADLRSDISRALDAAVRQPAIPHLATA